jgi:hypothetical protein
VPRPGGHWQGFAPWSANWKDRVNATQKIIDDYYRSPTWRRVKIFGIAGVVLYVVGMSIYLEYFAK